MAVPVSKLVVVTSTAPAVCGGVMQVSDVADTNVTLEQLVPPIVTVAPLLKPLPLRVMVVPPAIDPAPGVTDDRLNALGGKDISNAVPPPALQEVIVPASMQKMSLVKTLLFNSTSSETRSRK